MASVATQSSWVPFSWPSVPINACVENYLKSAVVPALRAGKIPRHIAFIMDGNRRFAKEKGMRKIEAHTMGFTALKSTLEWCLDLGVEVVTVYAFSIENFHRPKEEVDDLMELAKTKFMELLGKSELVHRHGVSIRILGDLSLLRPDVQAVLAKCMWDTRHNTKAILNVCFSYTAQHEMTQAVKGIASAVETGKLQPWEVCEDLIDQALYTGENPEVDVCVRTSGEVRLSDFLLWQTSFSLLEFMHVMWPEFSLWHLAVAVLDYQRQQPYVQSRRQQQQASRQADRQSRLRQRALEVLELSVETSPSEQTLQREMERLDSESTRRVELFLANLRQQRMDYVASLRQKE
eukprot:comp21541_c0_seq1/m.30005 comp21541_c0_seq1/g.30005  ORF comp21541_c0_seq1/g.30005 comp21541_c0_seq1/m.30005 type:complete len:348 (-) comp21541_c0_seq1:41-1084(-)